MKEFVTPKGTKLPLILLQGKPYLQVAHRIQWFREQNPTWSIETAVQPDYTQGLCLGFATIKDEKGRIICTGHKLDYSGSDKDMDYVERAETGAIGRALAYCGFGTQFATQDMEEGKKLADAPLNAPKPKPQTKPASGKSPMIKALEEAEKKVAKGEDPTPSPMNIPNMAEASLGTYVVKFGKKYNGKTLNSITIEDLISYVDYLTSTAKNKREPLTGPALEFVQKANEYLNFMESQEANEPDYPESDPNDWPSEPPPNTGAEDELPF